MQQARQEPTPEMIEAFRAKLLSNHRAFIEQYGHTVQGVFDSTGKEESYGYTVGLHKHGCELFIRNFHPSQMPIVNEIAERVRQYSVATGGHFLLSGSFPSATCEKEDGSSIAIRITELNVEESFDLIASKMTIARALVEMKDLAQARILSVTIE